MIIYLSTIAITVLLAKLLERVKQKRIILMIMILIPSFISGVRGVGTDYIGYQLRYNKILNGLQYDLDGTNLTVPFYKIMQMIGSVLFGYQSVIFVFSLLTITIAFFVFYKLRDDISFSFAVFSYMTLFYLSSYNLFRQFLSAELLILSLLYIKEGKNKFVITIPLILSIVIHSSSIIYLLILLSLYLIFKNIKFLNYVYFITIIFIVIIPLIASLLSRFANYLPHYAYYFLHFRYMGLGIGIFRYILLVWIPVFLINHHKKLFISDINNNYTEVIFITTMGSIFCLLSYLSDTFIYRIGYTGLCCLPIMLGLFIKKLRYNRHIVLIVFVIIHIIFMYYDFFYLNSGDIIPYSVFWR